MTVKTISSYTQQLIARSVWFLELEDDSPREQGAGSMSQHIVFESLFSLVIRYLAPMAVGALYELCRPASGKTRLGI